MAYYEDPPDVTRGYAYAANPYRTTAEVWTTGKSTPVVYSTPKPKPERKYYTVKVREDLVKAAGYDPDQALANYLRTKKYIVLKLDSIAPDTHVEWPSPHFASPYKLSQQGKYWVNAKREKLVIKEMDLEYVANVLDYIRKYKRDVYLDGSATAKYIARDLPSPLARALESRLHEAAKGTDTYRDRYRHHRKPNK